MSISDRITQARHDRSARAAVRATRQSLVNELAAYSTPAERMEIELIASRCAAPEAAVVLEILDSLAYTNGRTVHRLSA